MKRNRIKAYWLLLMALIYLAGAVLSVGETQARYVTTATWNTVVQQGENPVTSDCLEDVTAAPLTILLGTMPQETYSVNFTLTSTEDMTGRLKWTVDKENYISAKMCIGEELITHATDIALTAGETVTVTMVLIPFETLFKEIRPAENVSIVVEWEDSLKGTFLIQLPAVEEVPEETEPEETEPTEPEETEPTEPEETDPTEPEETKPTEPEETKPAEPEETNPTEPEETKATEPENTESGEGTNGIRIPVITPRLSVKAGTGLTIHTETSDEEIVSEEETDSENSGETQEETEGSTGEGTGEDNGENTDGEDTTKDEETTEDPSEPTEPEQEEIPPMTILLETVEEVNSAESLPIRISAPENGGVIRLGLTAVVESTETEGESLTILENFPRYTRFSLTDGDHYYMLYNADTIALKLEAGESVSLLLDLSRVELEQFQVVLGAAEQAEDAEVSTCAATVIPKEVRDITFRSRILSVDQPLEIAVSDFWQYFDLDFTVDMLTVVRDEDSGAETIAYVPVELDKACLWAELISDESGTKIIFSIGETLPPAGTYRVSLNWNIEELCYAVTQENFFINYMVNTEPEEIGGAEQ